MAVITVHFDEDEEAYRATAAQIVERNRLLNRDAIEAAERHRRIINSIGGFDAFERLQQYAKFEEDFTRLRPLIESAEKYERFVQSQGPLFSDLMALLQSQEESPEKYWRKITRFALYFGPKISDPEANKALRQIARDSHKKARILLEQRYFPAALMEVLARKDVRQRIRLGPKWIKTTRRRVRPKRPSDLFWYQFFLWIRKEVYNETEKQLLGKIDDQDATEKLLDGAFYETEETWYSSKKSSIADQQTFKDHFRKEFFGSSENDLDVLKSSDKFPLKSLLNSTDSLTPREQELQAILIKTGLNTPARLISKKMRIAESTARVFKRNLIQKFLLSSAI